MRHLSLLLFTLLLGSCHQDVNRESATFNPQNENIQIVLFHMERRCESCSAVEAETLSLLEEKFAMELEEGKIHFLSLAFPGKNAKQASKELQVSGQAFIIVKGKTRINLTQEAFLHAHPHPDRFKSKLESELQKLLE